MMKIDAQRNRPSSIEQDDAYYRKLVERIRTGGSQDSSDSPSADRLGSAGPEIF
jgi:hypothetical protein